MQNDNSVEEELLRALDRLSIPISLLKLPNGYSWSIWPLIKHGNAFSLPEAVHDALEALIASATFVR